ncbi:MAG: thioredoxin family protein [Pseudomonadota bacterium]|nr:MAG: thiol reductase thioredoxin [Pseudomonadota bacterium]
MTLQQSYASEAPAREEIDALKGPVVVEFGTPWCGYCRRAQPLIAEAFAGFEAVAHYKIEDGPGRPLGRSFNVKLWPTLVFMRDGMEVARLVRPESAEAIRQALARIAA